MNSGKPTSRRTLRHRFTKGVRVGVVIYLGIAPAIIANGQSCLEMADRWPYGTSTVVAADGAVAMVNSGAAIKFVDLTAPRNPVVFSEVVVDHMPVDMALNQALAVVLDERGFLYVIDLEGAAGPEIVGGIDIEGGSDNSAVELEGSIAYVAAQGLRVIDLSDPSAPVEIGVVNPSGEWAFDVSVAGDTAVVASHEDGMWVVDISDPSSPSRVSVFPQYTSQVEARGSFAYIPEDVRLRIVDLSEPASPVQIGVFSAGYSFNAFAVSPGGEFAYLVANGRLKVIDVGDPTSPIEVGETTTTEYSSALAAVEGIVVSIKQDVDLKVWNTEVPASPYLIGWLVLRNSWNDEVTVYGDRIYMVEGVSFRILDASDPRHIVELGVLYDNFTEGVAVYGDYAYVGGLSGFWVVDISDSSNPVAVSFHSLYFSLNPHTFLVAHDHLFLGGTSLVVFDLSDPQQPVEVGALSLGELSFSLVISGDHAYSVTWSGTSMVSIIDISVPWNPFLATSFEIPSNAYMVAADGDYLVSPNNSAGINVYDVSNPEDPQEVGSLDSIGANSVVAVAGDRAFVSSTLWESETYSYAIETVDLADPTNPAVIHSVDSLYPYGITVDGSRVFVANGDIGMTVFVDCTLLRDGFESGDTSAWSNSVP